MSSDIPANTSAGNRSDLLLASWIDRFIAWLIDFVIVNLVLWAIFAAVAIPFWLDGTPERWFQNADGPARWAITSLVFFAYWIYFETTTGQSLGKIALRLKTTDLDGNRANIRGIAIESFGKAFLLPIDLILGWIFSNEKRQRIFARAGDTIVIKISQQGSNSNVHYRKD
ncbi:MAG TPA: RDD family protein [Nitrososphaera sp.]|jgi:uncharacterized RDD family membrane protein YckC